MKKIGGIFLALALSAASCTREDAPAPLPSEAPAVTLGGGTAARVRTVVVPTLDTPIPPGKSVMWCASFQLAWNELKALGRGPVQVKNAEEVSDRLNKADDPIASLPAGSFYARAGRIKDGIAETIRKEMAERFPGKTFPDLAPGSDTAAVAYAYLAASMPFPRPFFNENVIAWMDPLGTVTPVICFGISATRHEEESKALRGQVSVLHYKDLGNETEYIVDPAKDSAPNQLILARIPRADTLAKTLERAQKLLGSGETLGDDEPLLIPNVSFLLHHHFKELEGTDKRLLNSGLDGLFIATALQSIRFELNRSGAKLESEAKVSAKKAAEAAKVMRKFVFDRPFLLVLKKRSANKPFFVLWVDNAEILTLKT